MTDNRQKQLGKTLWNIADKLRGAMNADDFRDYWLASLRTFKKGLMQQLFQSPEDA